ncbi:MAG: FKBP-type peptidyl-prolyl cis-trans isomerase [Rhodobacteraceae bacterium]|nr:FKBP-type peptidyl-prolyl cis-trans isomerase [Paracoccaceae bacterium]
MNRNLLIAAGLFAVAGLAYVLVIGQMRPDTDRAETERADATETAPANVEDSMPSSDTDWASEQQAFLTENIKKSGWVAMDNGMQYTVLKAVEGAGVKPARGSSVTVHYEGRLTNGEIFDSSYARDEPATFPLSGVIKGWQEGVPLMKVGEIWEFAIPANLAYGERGVGPIPGGSTLIFKIELLEAPTAAQ